MGQFTGVVGDVRDPYPAFHAMRRGMPISFDSEQGYEIFTYDLVAQVLRGNHAFPSGSIRELTNVVMGPYPLVAWTSPSTADCDRS